ncbi:hypothetical protein NEPTK9_001164 [Candidatus Neptunochlamydia vexilliferae]|uniref:Uncharacterized protein n=1 Tax=Candidatus Neptunichlamydia vexilliferae TaxID=1651774 RepID=A0ABS0AZT4_9BACT|nr:hypothetical protein [Candidatus Neptunochlamydia vexilliferae]
MNLSANSNTLSFRPFYIFLDADFWPCLLDNVLKSASKNMLEIIENQEYYNLQIGSNE